MKTSVRKVGEIRSPYKHKTGFGNGVRSGEVKSVLQSGDETGGTRYILSVPLNDTWVELGVDLYSPFVDTRPLVAANVPESREYRAAYLDGDTALTSFSQVVQVTVAV